MCDSKPVYQFGIFRKNDQWNVMINRCLLIFVYTCKWHISDQGIRNQKETRIKDKKKKENLTSCKQVGQDEVCTTVCLQRGKKWCFFFFFFKHCRSQIIHIWTLNVAITLENCYSTRKFFFFWSTKRLIAGSTSCTARTNNVSVPHPITQPELFLYIRLRSEWV